MAKQLIVCRHAEAAGTQPGSTDYARTLTSQGTGQAKQLAEWLGRAKLSPGLILCSAAARALATARIISGHFPQAALLAEQELYEATALHLLQRINKLPESAGQVLVVGHNPSVSLLAEHLTGVPTQLQPGQAICLQVKDLQWAGLSGGLATITHTFEPAFY